MPLPGWVQKLKHCQEGPEHCEGCMQVPELITALSIAWEALEYGYNGRSLKEPGMSVQSRPLTNSEIRLFLDKAMKRIEALGQGKA
jgi:hypothetical protein